MIKLEKLTLHIESLIFAGNPSISFDDIKNALEESLGAQYYEYCLDTVETCTAWINVGTEQSVFVSPLTDAETYYWQVRAVGSTATTYANGSEGASWSFTTFDSALMTEKGFLPLMTR